jgi:predicted MPP superfamily phosphohydrolase
MYLLISILALPLLILFYARFVEPNTLVVRKIRVKTGRIGNDGQPLRIALLSDFHYPRCANRRLIRRAFEASDRFDPDLVFLLGDFFDKRRKDPAILPGDIKTVFGNIRSQYGVFGVLGNHDHWFDAEAIRTALATETEIRLIDNASVRIELPGGPIYIAGVGDLRTGHVDYEKAACDIPPDAPIVLLSHNPDVVESIRDPRIRIQFSGHTHGGQVRLPFFGALRVPSRFGNRYSQGMSDKGNHLLYVNTGICSIRNIRFLCPPEVTWVEID